MESTPFVIDSTVSFYIIKARATVAVLWQRESAYQHRRSPSPFLSPPLERNCSSGGFFIDYLSSVATMVAHTTTMIAPIQIGDSTHHHDHSITWHSFSTINAMVKMLENEPQLLFLLSLNFIVLSVIYII